MTEATDACGDDLLTSLFPGEDNKISDRESTMWSQYPNFNDRGRRRPDVQRFQINFRTLARITKLSVGVNFLILLCFSFMYLPQVPKYVPRKIQLFEDSAKLFLPGEESHSRRRFLDSERMAPVESKPEACHKHLAVFGIRDFWFTFCKYDRFASNYSYLVDFPRTFRCEEIDCDLTMNFTKEPADLRGKDLVLFTEVDPWLTPEKWDWAVGNRTAGQRWVMVTEESPFYVPGMRPPEKYGSSAFDWIGSYKRDSDFVQPYGYYTPFTAGEQQRPGYVEFDGEKVLARKQKLPMVLWLGSHCQTLHWDRMRFVSDFEELVSMKKYGRCANWPDKKGEFLQWNNETVIREVLSRYKFYLSLENSCCNDYVSEKFWRTLQYNIVPIVVGPPLADYERIAPPNSFIHPDQFDSMMDMAMYIVELASDDEKYLKYFEWKKKGSVFVYSQEEYYLHPLKNETNCGILKKFLRSEDRTSGDPSHQRLDYFGPKWHQSCGPCSRKSWLKDKYMHPPDYRISGEV